MARRFGKLIFFFMCDFFNLQKLREIDQNFFIVPVGTNTFDLICMINDAFLLDTPLILIQSTTKLSTSAYIKQALATAIRYIM